MLPLPFHPRLFFFSKDLVNDMQIERSVKIAALKSFELH
jgi:hypothetical protein